MQKKNKYVLHLFLAFFLVISFFGTSISTKAANDVTPPTLESLKVSHSNVTSGNQVQIQAKVTDDLSGVDYVAITYNAPTGNGSKYTRLYYNESTGLYEGSFTIGEYDAMGIWNIGYIYFYDKLQNSYAYYHNLNSQQKYDSYEYKDLSEYAITVSGNVSDDQAPKLNSLTVTPKEVSKGDTVLISANITDNLSGVDYVAITYNAPTGNGSKYTRLYYNESTGLYEGSFTIGEYDAMGIWNIGYIYFYDKLQNSYAYYHNSNSQQKYDNYEYKNLSDFSFNVKESDSEPPVTKMTTNSNSREWNLSDVQVELNAVDNSTGVAKTEYRINYGDWQEYTAPFKVTLEGQNKVEFRSIDTAGNKETIKSEIVKIDKTSPVTTHSDIPTNWTKKDVSATLSTTDENSGVAKTEYRINNGEWTEYNGSFNSFIEGMNTVDYRSVDNAGNVEAYKSFEVDIDKTVPQTTLSPVKDEWYNSDVTLTLESSDNLSGVARTEYRVNNGDWQAYNGTISISDEGINKVEFRSIDNAGNVEKTKSVEIKIDKTAPTLNVSFDQSVLTDRNHQLVPIKVLVDAKDTLSGVALFELVSVVSNQMDNGKGDGNTSQDIQGAEIGTSDTNFSVRVERSGSGDRVYTVTYKATDNAGNTVTTSQDIVVKQNNSNN
ncbi:OmpL47-type beta-barrel domain-containing protein [Neobacillus driksii]|uniref:OmpL47-type beta-barrel domain-containing protein n=1 Tax=Neobacillus driksii TaxID=3035913 RepID=UPI0035932992